MTETRPSTGTLGLGFLRRGSREASAIDGVLDTYRRMYPRGRTGLIERAYRVAEEAHRGQLRKSGEPYITHPIAVAQIIADLGMPDSVIAAALLHDVVEDTEYPLERMQQEFGDEVAMIVDGVTKLDKVQYGDAAQAETVRKMVVAMAKDIRVLLLKLCDRLHNARTWKYVAPESARKKAQETLEIYAPLAHRMGLNAIKWELEDLSFQTLYPKIYQEIVDVVTERAPEREKYLAQVRAEIEKDLRQMKIKAEITGRPKHYYSVYQKMIVRGRDLNDIYDLVGIRILVETVRDCYAVLGAMHARYQPVPGRFKDYIAMPKFNLYQSLHTTVIGPTGKPVELQIRTYDMHRRAEYGLAAHWRYKETAKTGQPSKGGGEMGWLRQIADWQQETADPTEFLDSLRGEISKAEVYVFTPRGKLLSLPQGATPVDFAYAVHTEVGHKTIGAKVNGRLVPLDSTLENGDTVEVLTTSDENAHPKRDWLEFVQSTRARNKIRQWFTRERREESIETGRDMLARAIRRQQLPMQRLMSRPTLLALAKEMHYEDVDALYAAIGEHKEQPADVVARMTEAVGGQEGADEDLTEITRPGLPPQRISARRGDPGVSVHGLTDVVVKLARCCTPVPGDPIQGFITRGSGVSVHRADCDNLAQLHNQSERLIDVEWTGHSAGTFLVQIEVEALDRNRLLSDVTQVLSDHHVNILSANVSTTRERVAMSSFQFEMADPSHLGAILSAVRRIDGVYDARRVTGAKRP
ncbi:bifunctional (p)ppGpp synthetase/guanosine-3',5'-bis(diphosphate) 3'-pyrophosphohydrolase [Demequina sp. SYSU T00192]|uniref:Bifunctional (P)ppGpp synthetase/guanosine-3',5'-bis(Diphosphate) 3'-pyrophosphohydrolase n=1 Tax=Demequina litoralis TaxID=3051660 RepID=A0ABT8G686_9MICO|nr:bifunctional (p)ppGpp synthetase/guanosine-3',5'-bis(diphosphate) 3'-pyrophosphohydrolase [Demequina sp. SYSU T00192]MDN4474517.1 bifunctional (p)ppGpp synthetase/guanosine-3',5'-bis(diphosphate) 3'-pyrophosphohydrolase [Demequina sp. SYSU T00192]